ncbi:hypothetical protein CERZMDRAFT_89298 [Cercospora zeae-maydis SCOH1-5]|uniref:Uncharacterized protein n=1 Tax=Cercospora zeae-maydis SCOH1-5 TaxID=717836 RepID=A0A6A6EZN9_9PEZI|nr:hypothetical protein CERZMDRAFT_89298 [Cercospora zeae-maydis SCOH1-5]
MDRTNHHTGSRQSASYRVFTLSSQEDYVLTSLPYLTTSRTLYDVLLEVALRLPPLTVLSATSKSLRLDLTPHRPPHISMTEFTRQEATHWILSLVIAALLSETCRTSPQHHNPAQLVHNCLLSHRFYDRNWGTVKSLRSWTWMSITARNTRQLMGDTTVDNKPTVHTIDYSTPEVGISAAYCDDGELEYPRHTLYDTCGCILPKEKGMSAALRMPTVFNDGGVPSGDWRGHLAIKIHPYGAPPSTKRAMTVTSSMTASSSIPRNAPDTPLTMDGLRFQVCPRSSTRSTQHPPCQAGQPCADEQHYGGDGRIATDRLHRRFPAVPRVPGNATVNWQQSEILSSHGLWKTVSSVTRGSLITECQLTFDGRNFDSWQRVMSSGVRTPPTPPAPSPLAMAMAVPFRPWHAAPDDRGGILRQLRCCCFAGNSLAADADARVCSVRPRPTEAGKSIGERMGIKKAAGQENKGDNGEDGKECFVCLFFELASAFSVKPRLTSTAGRARNSSTTTAMDRDVQDGA